ncbi:MAG: Rrf2 family transcriptional regulator [Ancalomicrobiaceae bacterium]|nr:Rrf2 family transcriptional regulator [Ancalomicrobiaceae bacterium]
MKLTSYSNYSMRVLMVAAARSPGLTKVRDVSDGFRISEAHLVKCVHQLGTWGFLETVRGNRGGFRLARKAEDIRVGEVIRLTEDAFTLVECFDPATNRCPIVDRCKLRLALRRATDAFLAVLDGLTLADIASNGDELLRILDLRPTPAAGCLVS